MPHILWRAGRPNGAAATAAAELPPAFACSLAEPSAYRTDMPAACCRAKAQGWREPSSRHPSLGERWLQV